MQIYKLHRRRPFSLKSGKIGMLFSDLVALFCMRTALAQGAIVRRTRRRSEVRRESPCSYNGTAIRVTLFHCRDRQVDGYLCGCSQRRRPKRFTWATEVSWSQ
jgi:hypothetical protein